MAETKYYSYNWPMSGTAWYRNGRPEDARKFFWDEYRDTLLAAIEEEIKNGWQPVTEVGPSAISLRTESKNDYSFSFGDVLAWILTAGILLFLHLIKPGKDTYYYPSEFKVLLKRN